MDKKTKIEVVIVCILLLVMGYYVEQSDKLLGTNYTIERQATGEGDKEVDLILNAEGLENYKYNLNVEEIHMDSDKADEYFEKAKKEINSSICAEGETVDRVTQKLNTKSKYVNDIVSVEWYFSGADVINSDGSIIEENLSDNGDVVEVSAQMSCKEFKSQYNFSINVQKRHLSKSEQIIRDVKAAIKNESNKPNQKVLKLPKEVGGTKLEWKESKRHLVFKILLFEVVIFVLLKFMKIEQEKDAYKKRQESLKLDYSDIVSKISILMGSGMSIKQAWTTISTRYLKKRGNDKKNYRAAYEEMLVTTYEMEDGESERIAYQRFGERTGMNEYHRFARILAQSLQKGSNGVCEMLEKEACEAFEQRKVYARKLGEEASTKMLIPLLMMLGIIIAIIMVPAAFSFNV